MSCEAVDSHGKEADEDMLSCLPRAGRWDLDANEATGEVIDCRSADSMEEVCADLSVKETG